MNSYWNNSGELQAQYEELNKLIPVMGKVEGKGNKKLNALRTAANAYYDIFNNGGCNRASEIRRIFGINFSDFRIGGRRGTYNWDGMMEVADPVITKKIEAAYAEQKAKGTI